MRELDLYLEALKRVGRWADAVLERETADAVLVAIGFELARLGVDVGSVHCETWH